MVECPWCYEQVRINNGRCEKCNEEIHIVNEQDINEIAFDSEEYDEELGYGVDIEDIILSNFKCNKCKCNECSIKEVAMTGTGLSKIFDIQHHHYLFVSCSNCGSVEIYNPSVLRGKKSGELGSILDLLF